MRSGILIFFKLLVLISISRTGQCQINTIYEQSFAKEFITSFDDRYRGVKGTPFLFDNWNEGSLRMRYVDNQISVVDEVKIKMNVHNTHIFANPKGSNQVLELNRAVDQISLYLDKDTMHYQIMRIDDQKRITEIMVQAKINLIKVHYKEFKKADYTGAYSTGKTYDEYRTENSYYVQYFEELHKVKNSRKFWIGLFPGWGDKIKEYYKNNSTKGEEFIIGMVNYISDLLE